VKDFLIPGRDKQQWPWPLLPVAFCQAPPTPQAEAVLLAFSSHDLLLAHTALKFFFGPGKAFFTEAVIPENAPLKQALVELRPIFFINTFGNETLVQFPCLPLPRGKLGQYPVGGKPGNRCPPQIAPVTAPLILIGRLDQSGANRIAVDITDQFQKALARGRT
jgi:hypothetical protein